MLHPKSDIRSMFNNTRGGGHAHVATMTASEVAATASTIVASIISTAVDTAEKKKTTKITKIDPIESLCNAYYKAYTGDKCKGIVNHDAESVKEMLKDIVETCKVKPKKLYRYFHHVKVSTRENIFPIQHLLLYPFDFITFENQFISYKNAMCICNEKKVVPPLE